MNRASLVSFMTHLARGLATPKPTSRLGKGLTRIRTKLC